MADVNINTNVLNNKSLTPQQREIGQMFKEVATAETPQEKQEKFIKLIGFLNQKKALANQTAQAGQSLLSSQTNQQFLDPNSLVRQGEI